MDQGQQMMQGPMDPSQMQGGPPPQQGGMPPQMGQDPSQGMMQEGMPGEQEDSSQDQSTDNYIDYALQEANLAKKLYKTEEGKKKLDEIGQKILEGFNEDEQSRKGWMEKNQEWIKLATLAKETRTFPWPNASNVKFPLVATASMQFGARAYPSLVPADGQVVKVKVIGNDPDGSRQARAINIAKHMSYQVMYRMPNWEEDMDRICVLNPMVGTTFKKTYCVPGDKKLVSELVLPQHLCISYWAKDVDSAYRKTEYLFPTKNEVISKVRNDEEYLECALELVENTAIPDTKIAPGGQDTRERDKFSPPFADATTPYVFLACHTFYDLDDDGYEEPYVITIHKDTGKVVRITARWQSDGVKRNQDGEVICIEPVESFTKFGFIPNPESNIYDLGFGALLGDQNEAVNTLINQLIDAGTLSNMQSGFLGKGLRVKMGQVALRPGEWRIVNATGDEMKNSIFPLPIKEPSMVLFQLLQLLISSGNQLASIADIMVGKMPGQNTPATTTQETVDQSMKVFTAIYKRMFRALYREFKKIYNLNRLYPDIVKEETQILNVPLQVSDYDGPADDVVPGGDPTGDSLTVRMAKLQQIQPLVQMQLVNPQTYAKNYVEMLEMPNPQEWQLPPPDPNQKSPEQQQAEVEMQAKQQDMQIKQQLGELQIQLKQQQLELEKQKAELELMVSNKKAEANVQQTEMKTQAKQREQDMNMHIATQKATHEMNVDRARAANNLQLERQAGVQKLQHGAMAFDAKMQQAKTQTAFQQKAQKATKPPK